MKTILVLTDFSEKANHAAEFAWQLAVKLRADLIFYNSYFEVPEPIGMYAGVFPVDRTYANLKRQSMEKLQELTDGLIQKFYNITTDYVPAYRCENGMGNLGVNISEFLDREDIWMVVMGDKRKESFLSEVTLMNDTDNVIEHASCPVLLIPEKVNYHSIKTMALALGSVEPVDVKALNFFAELAEPFRAEIVVTHVSPDKTVKEKALAHELLEDFYQEGAEVDYENITFHNIYGDNVTKALIRFEQTSDLDMIALIHKKHSLYQRIFHESTTTQRMGYHTIPLLIFPFKYM